MLDKLKELNDPEINSLLKKMETLDDPTIVIDHIERIEKRVDELNENLEELGVDFYATKEKVKELDEFRPKQGEKGDKGDKGDRGDTGAKGDKGDK
jgi:hypothetical protein